MVFDAAALELLLQEDYIKPDNHMVLLNKL